MRRALGPQYDQVLMFPPVVEDWIGREHPARFIREVVGRLDLRALGFATRESAEGGEYFPATCLLAVWLYGYFRKIRSVRELERSCGNDLGFIWLVGLRTPDHNTLWNFYHQHRAAIGRLFKESVKMALRMDLVGLVLQAIDGTKIQAVCAGRISQNKEAHAELLASLEQSIAQTEQAIAQAEAAGEAPAAQLPRELQDQKRLREKVAAAVAEMEQSGRKHCHAQEPEARRVETEGSNRFGYNAQAVVDGANQVIVAAEVFTQETDHGLLVPMAEAARENLGVTVVSVADRGYAGSESFAAAEAAQLPVFTSLPERWQPAPGERFHTSQFVYDPQRNCLVCPAGQSLPQVRTREKEGVRYAVYRSKSACAHCPLRSECTSDRNGRTIELGPHDEALHRQRLRQDAPAVKAVLRQRSRIVEPVFAQIKMQGRFRRWTVRGLANVQAQWNWLCTSWNLRVIYRQWRGQTAATAAIWGHQLQAIAAAHA